MTDQGAQFVLSLNILALEAGTTRFIWRENLPRLCRAFGGRDWIGKFDHPAGTPEGNGERATALAMAAEILA